MPSACSSERSRTKRPPTNRNVERGVVDASSGAARKARTAHAALLARPPRARGPRPAGPAPRAPARPMSRWGGRSSTTRPSPRRRKWTSGWAERQAQHRLGHVGRLGGLGLEELEPRRRVEEEVAHLDLRAVGHAASRRSGLDARLDDQAEAGRAPRAAGAPASAARPPRSTAAPRRESRRWQGPTDRRASDLRRRVTAQRQARVRRPSCRRRRRPRESGAARPPRSRRRCAGRRRRWRSRPAP